MTGPLGLDPDDLSTCIGCGYCLPACPTYDLTRVETSSPRGRISLMRAVEAGRLDITDATIVEQAKECLGCRACESACPTGVPYGRMLEQWRTSTWKKKPLRLRLLLSFATKPRLLRMAAAARRGPRRPRDRNRQDAMLMLGCYERVIYPRLGDGAASTTAGLTVEPQLGCCGALHAHNGDLATGIELARELGHQADDRVIVTTAGGCAAHLVEHLGAERVTDISSWLHKAHQSGLLELNRLRTNGRPLRIAVQDSCHLRHGTGIATEIRELCDAIGERIDLPELVTCCGSAGTYSLLRPTDAQAVFDTRVEALERVLPDLIIVANPGCHRFVAQQLRRHDLPIKVMHLAELVKKATIHPATRRDEGTQQCDLDV